MRIQELITEAGGVGKIVKGVNTTPDVHPGEIKRQAAKFGMQVDDESRPPIANPDGTVGENSEEIAEKWTKKYKRSIDCSHPRGFSQKAHCAARRKRQAGGKTKSRSVSESQIPSNVLETIDMLMEQHGLSNENAVSVVLESLDESLRDWFKEKWVRFGPDGKIRGACARGKSSEGKPKCLPQAKAHALGKKARAKAARRKRREDPNPERKGKAHNVATKESRIYESAVEDLAKKLKQHQHVLKNLDKDALYDKINDIMQNIATEHGITAKTLHKDWMAVHHEWPDNWIMSVSETASACPHCGGNLVSEAELQEKQDACYYKVRRRYKVWPSAYACVPESTSKALTRDGWKSVEMLRVGDEIMTFNRGKDLLEYKPILRLHRYTNAKTVTLQSGNTGFIFESTLNHKWVVKLPETETNNQRKYEKINGYSLLTTQQLMDSPLNKHIVVSAFYSGGKSLKKDKIFKYGDNWIKYILDITEEQRQSWLFSAIVYDGNQMKTQRLINKSDNMEDLDYLYSGNHNKQSFGFKQKDVMHRDAFLLSAFLNGGSVSFRKNQKQNIFQCYYVSHKRYKNTSNLKKVSEQETAVWCPETENSTWVMKQETENQGIITITGNSGALVQCRKRGAKNWGNKSK